MLKTFMEQINYKSFSEKELNNIEDNIKIFYDIDNYNNISNYSEDEKYIIYKSLRCCIIIMEILKLIKNKHLIFEETNFYVKINLEFDTLIFFHSYENMIKYQIYVQDIEITSSTWLFQQNDFKSKFIDYVNDNLSEYLTI